MAKFWESQETRPEVSHPTRHRSTKLHLVTNSSNSDGSLRHQITFYPATAWASHQLFLKMLQNKAAPIVSSYAFLFDALKMAHLHPFSLQNFSWSIQPTDFMYSTIRSKRRRQKVDVPPSAPSNKWTSPVQIWGATTLPSKRSVALLPGVQCKAQPTWAILAPTLYKRQITCLITIRGYLKWWFI